MRAKLNAELQQKVCDALRFGVPLEVACGHAGIGRRTFFEWRARGEKGEEPYAAFLAATEMAQDSVEAYVTANILAKAKTNWQAGAWWLRFRKTGGKQQIELTGKDGQPLSGTLTSEAAELIRQKILYGDKAPAQLPQEAAVEVPEPTEAEP